ncbi:Transcription factor fungi [Macrophomina phaseolina MS6]|uniref:Transcription factor fungi n=1 Tax=Macrophomina phaseolina (strain MS6) TaxID=1126212 RepID=K2SAD2_MACPH|nr:Transcription factor fungi [Macrophomina phaseolina MS6]
MFIGQSMLLRPLLERAFQDYKLPSSRPASSSSCSDFTADSQALKRKLISIAESSHPDDSAPPVLDESARPTAKRSRVENEVATFHNPETNIPTFDPLIPPQDILVRLVDLYFLRLHPWIPVLHVRSFREQMNDTSQHPKLASIFHAIVSVCARFSIDPYYISHSDLRGLCKRCRDTVILKSMETVTVQNLQALVIVAFDIIGSGRGPMAWSVVNSLTRSVEQLQLSVEDGEEDSLRNGDEYLFRRMSFLKSVNNWVESEERRRVFWNVFLMDRFCSIGTGWNNSLTSADVRRRLPCEGAIWEAGSPVITPYFGIGESMTPAQQGLTPTTERFTANENEADSIGGFAFCIEATESLNLVTKFFLQHGINFRSLQSIQIWLMRFKELDLRLVR